MKFLLDNNCSYMFNLYFICVLTKLHIKYKYVYNTTNNNNIIKINIKP